MTHEELLAKVNKDIENDEWYDKTAVFNFHIYAKALRAVVELHKPDNINYTDGTTDPYCKGCAELNCAGCDDAFLFHWPCPTIQQIIENLK